MNRYRVGIACNDGTEQIVSSFNTINHAIIAVLKEDLNMYGPPNELEFAFIYDTENGTIFRMDGALISFVEAKLFPVL